MSETRKVYIGRLIGRCVIFVICLFMYLFRRDFFTVLDGMNFFKEFSLLHLLWGVWVVDMTLQIIPIKNKVPLGSQKFFSSRFKRCIAVLRMYRQALYPVLPETPFLNTENDTKRNAAQSWIGGVFCCQRENHPAWWIFKRK